MPQFEQKCMRALSQAAATYTSARVAGAASHSLNDPPRGLTAHSWARSVALLSKQGRAQIPRTTPQETETHCSVVHVCCTTMITFARAGINWGLPVHVFACIKISKDAYHCSVVYRGVTKIRDGTEQRDYEDYEFTSSKQTISPTRKPHIHPTELLALVCQRTCREYRNSELLPPGEIILC